jgi:hypothetical protein
LECKNINHTFATLLKSTHDDSLAQSVEQRPFKPWVLRSNRRRVTSKKPLPFGKGFFVLLTCINERHINSKSLHLNLTYVFVGGHSSVLSVNVITIHIFTVFIGVYRRCAIHIKLKQLFICFLGFLSGISLHVSVNSVLLIYFVLQKKAFFEGYQSAPQKKSCTT